MNFQWEACGPWIKFVEERQIEVEEPCSGAETESADRQAIEIVGLKFCGL